MIATDRVQTVVLVDFPQELCSLRTRLPDGREFQSILWRPVLPAWANDCLFRTGHRCKEIAVGLPTRALESKTFEVLATVLGRSKINLMSIVQDGDLVEDVVSGLRGLVDCHTCTGSHEFCRLAK